MSKKSNKPPKKEDYPHFRHYIKSNHPAMITSEYSDDEYNFRKVTHSEKDGRHLNIKIEPNPNPQDKNAMYVTKRIRHDKKRHFSKWKYSWKKPQK